MKRELDDENLRKLAQSLADVLEGHSIFDALAALSMTVATAEQYTGAPPEAFDGFLYGSRINAKLPTEEN